MKKLLTILILLCSLSSFGQFGMFQAHNRYSIIEIEFGYQYNWYAATDAREITNTGWHVPTLTECQTLADYLGAAGNYTTNSVGGKIKETGTVYWSSPNTGATNETGFNLRGVGVRDPTGAFLNQGNICHVIISTEFSATAMNTMSVTNSLDRLLIGGAPNKKNGFSVRPLKDSTTLSDGQTGTYTGNDGKVYRTICIGTQEWVADNIAETKYRNGDPIPEVTDGTTWSGLTTGGRCVYDNDENNR